MKNVLSKIILTVSLALFLLGCAVTSTGAISINGRPAKIEITENTPDGIMVQGMDISINSEFMGTAKRIGKTSGTLMNSKISFEPIQSKYGEIRVIQNITGSFSQAGVNFDVFIADEYAGNVQMSNIL